VQKVKARFIVHHLCLKGIKTQMRGPPNGFHGSLALLTSSCSET
jgi:hypothetical protein